MAVLAWEDLTSCPWSSSNVMFPKSGEIGISPTWNWYVISLQSDCGGLIGQVFKSGVSPIQNHVNCCCVMGDPESTGDFKWHGLLLLWSTGFSSSGLLDLSVARTTCSRIVCQDGAIQSEGQLSGGPAGSSAFTPQNVMCPLTCLLFDAGLSIEYIRQRARRFQTSRWADTTKGTLNSQQRLFIEFCRRYEIHSFKNVDGQCLIDYAVWLIVSGRLHSVDSVRNYLSAVRTLCRMFGHDCPTPTTHWELEWTLIGIRRELQFPTQRKKPISPGILRFLLTFPSDMYNPPTNLSWEEQVLMSTIQVTYCLAYFSMTASTIN